MSRLTARRIAGGNLVVSAEAMPLDVLEMRRQFGGDDELISEVMLLFLEDYPSRLNAIAMAIDARDADLVKRGAHTLKGSAATLSAFDVVTAASALEALSSSDDPAALAGAFDRLVAEIDRLAGTLREICSGGIA